LFAKIDFREKYAKLIDNSIPKRILVSVEDRGGCISERETPLVTAYKEKCAHARDEFIKNYCEEY